MGTECVGAVKHLKISKTADGENVASLRLSPVKGHSAPKAERKASFFLDAKTP